MPGRLHLLIAVVIVAAVVCAIAVNTAGALVQSAGQDLGGLALLTCAAAALLFGASVALRAAATVVERSGR